MSSWKRVGVTCQQAQEDADQDGSVPASRHQDGDDGESKQGEQDRRRRQVAQPHQCGWVIGDDTTPLQTDQRNEQANTHSDGILETAGQCSNQALSQPEAGKKQEEASGDESGTERLLPGVAECQDHGVGEENVMSHAGCQSNGIVGQKTHAEGSQRAGQAGRHHDRSRVHAGRLQ